MNKSGVKESTQTKFLIIDDHEIVLNGMIDVIKKEYPHADLLLAKTKQEAIEKLNSFKYELVIVDIGIPESFGKLPKFDVGIALLKTLFKEHPNLNIVVQSVEPEKLVVLKQDIQEHRGGFSVANKNLTIQQMLAKVDLALKGEHCTPIEIRGKVVELKEDWLIAIALKFKEGLDDPEIARRMGKSESTVRHYWKRIRDELNVYPEAGKDLQLQTLFKLQEMGVVS